MRVLALCNFPVEAAATRFRLEQFVGPLRQRGIDLDIHPFLSSRQFEQLYAPGSNAAKALGLAASVLRRIVELTSARNYDLLLVQREAMFFGPAIFEVLFHKLGRMPIILDLDDATYVRYISPTYGRIGSSLKFFGKTDRLIERAAAVLCGNRFIAEHVESIGTKAIVLPTVVDTGVFRPADRTPDESNPTIGWIGTHSTFPFVERLFPVIAQLAETHKFVLKIVGSGIDSIRLDRVDVLNLPWAVEREIADFQSIDIGLYPIFASGAANADWIAGKSGFKAIQYLAVGVPFVMSPVGVCGEIGENEVTHFNAATDTEWQAALDKLLTDADLRHRMGTAGRRFSLDNYRVETQADVIAAALKEVAVKPVP